ncbi:MAG: hypothetical protein JXN65_01540 [Clostridia bacterium]|nr:hypothetical protein [Clostridia bacterium]
MIPVNIALTGHRDLLESDIPLYKNKIKLILADIRAKYPNSEIQFLCGMAEGADTLGAQAALETGCSLVAVLPMAEDEYIKTFTDYEKNAAEFKALLSKAKKIIDLSQVIKNNDETDPYVRLGVYLAEHSQRIIALWNGIYNGKPGGTSSVIKFALEGVPRKYRKKYSIVNSYDTIPVCHIPVVRTGGGEGAAADYIRIENDGYATLYPSMWDKNDSTQMVEYYDKQLSEIDIFNKHCAKKGLSSCADGCSIDSPAPSGIEKITSVQSAADYIAGRLQKKTFRLLIAQLTFGFFVFFWVTLVDEILPFMPYVLFLSPLFFLLCVLTSAYINRNGLENRYYDYRALAECLRVQYFWKSVGIDENAYSCYSKKSEFELGWIIAAAKNASMDANYNLALNGNQHPNYNFIKDGWMTDQVNYFLSKIAKDKKTISSNKKKMYTLFGASLVFVVMLIIERLYLRSILGNDILMHLLLFLIDASLAGGAIFSSFLDKRQLESELRQYSRMVIIFKQGINEFDSVCKSGTKAEIEQTIIEMGTDALEENADWVVFNKMSSIDIPMG